MFTRNTILFRSPLKDLNKVDVLHATILPFSAGGYYEQVSCYDKRGHSENGTKLAVMITVGRYDIEPSYPTFCS